MPKIVLALVAAALALSACNTLQGAGQDISTAGDAISEEAQDSEQEM